jgi:type IV pilus assembly protein PilA
MSRTRRAGFTLIELLIVVVIIGVLAAIAVPKFASTKGKANVAAMRSDLHNVAVAQEAYTYDHGTYTGDVAELRASLSPGVQILELNVSPGGWSAQVTHPQAYPKTCSLFVGAQPPLAPATAEGVVGCDN